MNILDIIILAILAYGLLAGMHRGSITSFLSMCGFSGAWFGAKTLYERIANMALSNTTLMAVLTQYLEPESFFDSHSQAVTAVSDVIAGGESAISAAVNAVSSKFAFLSNAFSANVRNQAFSKLGLNTLAEYFDQTLWVAVFNVAAFLLAFVVLYWLISLVVNLLDRTISFPVFRGIDWLLGGVFGVVCSSVVVILVLSILPSLASLISADFSDKLLNGSTMYGFVKQFDFLQAANWIVKLVGG